MLQLTKILRCSSRCRDNWGRLTVAGLFMGVEGGCNYKERAQYVRLDRQCSNRGGKRGRNDKETLCPQPANQSPPPNSDPPVSTYTAPLLTSSVCQLPITMPQFMPIA